MRGILIHIRRKLVSNAYLGRYLSPEEWTCLSESLGTKIGERFPVLPVLQLLKQERYTARKTQKPWKKHRDSFIETLLSEKECTSHKVEWYRTIKSLYDYIINHSSEQPKRAIFESFINAAFEARKWQETVDCFEALQKSSVAVTNQDRLFLMAAVCYGKLGRWV